MAPSTPTWAATIRRAAVKPADYSSDLEAYGRAERLAIIRESTGCDEDEARRKLVEQERWIAQMERRQGELFPERQ